MKAIAYVAAALLFAGAAHAKQSEDLSVAPDAASTHAEGAPGKHKKAQSSHQSAATHKAYARQVATEIRRHSPQATRLHGKLSVHFTIGASGRVVSHKIVSASDPALASEVGKILAAVHAPSPPGGSFSANQLFVFH
jgi:outer membrane biosynthesis protein TonB